MFYVFDQNNSGGYFLTDDELGVSHEMWIEADSKKEANAAFEIIRNRYNVKHGSGSFDNYCECCGRRWSGICSWKELEKIIEDVESGTIIFKGGSVKTV